MKQLVLATHNKDKFQEMHKALATSGWDLIPAYHLPEIPEVVEDGKTLEENSFKKADALCRFSGLAALGDDTGLFVHALQGEPGIYAARYAGENCTYSDNVKKLLDSMKNIPLADRSAIFRTSITICYPSGEVDRVTGEVRGTIESTPKGKSGFGYDPIFRPEGSDRVFAEMSLNEKNEISHRGLALKEALTVLKKKLS